LVFAPNFFNRPGQNLTLKVRQLKAGIIDNSDPNAANIIINQSAITDIRNNQDKVGILTGGGLTFALTNTVPFTSLQNGQSHVFRMNTTCATLATLNVDGLGDIPLTLVKHPDGTGFSTVTLGDLQEDSMVEVVYDSVGGVYQVLGGRQVGLDDITAVGIIEDEASAVPNESNLDFQGAGVTVSNVAGVKNVVTIPGFTSRIISDTAATGGIIGVDVNINVLSGDYIWVMGYSDVTKDGTAGRIAHGVFKLAGSASVVFGNTRETLTTDSSVAAFDLSRISMTGIGFVTVGGNITLRLNATTSVGSLTSNDYQLRVTVLRGV